MNRAHAQPTATEGPPRPTGETGFVAGGTVAALQDRIDTELGGAAATARWTIPQPAAFADERASFALRNGLSVAIGLSVAAGLTLSVLL